MLFRLLSCAASAANPVLGLMRLLSMFEMPYCMLKLNRGAPADPFFVKIWITPALASDPYSVAAAAPFRISIRSIVSGLMLSNGREVPPLPWTPAIDRPLSIRTPSR